MSSDARGYRYCSQCLRGWRPVDVSTRILTLHSVRRLYHPAIEKGKLRKRQPGGLCKSCGLFSTGQMLLSPRAWKRTRKASMYPTGEGKPGTCLSRAGMGQLGSLRLIFLTIATTKTLTMHYSNGTPPLQHLHSVPDWVT